jgi:hypothetical protein
VKKSSCVRARRHRQQDLKLARVQAERLAPTAERESRWRKSPFSKKRSAASEERLAEALARPAKDASAPKPPASAPTHAPRAEELVRFLLGTCTAT